MLYVNYVYCNDLVASGIGNSINAHVLQAGVRASTRETEQMEIWNIHTVLIFSFSFKSKVIDYTLKVKLVCISVPVLKPDGMYGMSVK